MAIVKMKRLRLIGMQPDREELLRLLQRMGCVEIDQPDVDLDDPQWAGLSAPDSAALNEARENGACANAALNTLKRYATGKGGMFQPRPTVKAEDFFDDSTFAAALETARAVNHAQRQIQTLQSERNKLLNQKASLAPWLSLDVPLDVTSTRDVAMQLGTIPSRVSLDQVVADLSDAAALAQLIPASSDGDAHYVLFLCHNKDLESANAVLRECGFTPTSLKGWTGTAATNNKMLDNELLRLDSEIKEQEDAIAARAPQLEALQRCVDRADQEISRQEATGRLLETGTAFYLDGWIPAESVADLQNAMSAYACSWELTDPTEEEYPKVPIRLKNNKVTDPLNMVTNMYVLPTYDGIDPNPLMAPFFVAFFGLMMADMAYGLVMLFLGWLLLKKMHSKPGTTMHHMGGLFILCGISTFLFGLMTGGFLGDFIPQIAKLINPNSTLELPALFTPLNDTLAILIGSLILGAIQVFTGMLISVVRKTQAGNFADALWDEITWWVVLGGAGLAILGVGNVAGYPIVLFVGLLMLLYGSTRKAKGFGKVTALIGAVYNGATGFFSDILSYARLMALMLAGSVIAQVFNTLGTVTGNIVTFVIISLIGNTLNFALNILGCYVHDLRLQCLEFFGRFYQEGGRAFKPLTVNTKYVDVIQK